MTRGTSTIAHPSATVVLLRGGHRKCEALLVHRNARLDFHGGAWVFPGGRIDPGDFGEGEDPRDVLPAARRAAVREVREETGALLSPEDLVLLSRWITPEPLPKRFDTWFFAAAADDAQVRVDGAEIDAFCWLPPAEALQQQKNGQLILPPPTYVTLLHLAEYRNAHEVLAGLARRHPETFRPRVRATARGTCTLYEGDVAYDGGDLDRPGPRHRLWMTPSGWSYERNR